jgi:hypothetical protein
MTSFSPPPGSADEGLGKVDRGQRVEVGPDGKERARFARPKVGLLPPDTDSRAGQSPVTVESVVEVAEDASVWEALEEEDGQP